MIKKIIIFFLLSSSFCLNAQTVSDQLVKRSLFQYLGGDVSLHSSLNVIADQALNKMLEEINNISDKYYEKKILGAKREVLLFQEGFYDYLVRNRPMDAANLSSLLLGMKLVSDTNLKTPCRGS